MRSEYDFSNSKRGAIVKTAKERITIRLDPDIIAWFRDRVCDGGNYQTLINAALREHIEDQSKADPEAMPRRVFREELVDANP